MLTVKQVSVNISKLTDYERESESARASKLLRNSAVPVLRLIKESADPVSLSGLLCNEYMIASNYVN